MISDHRSTYRSPQADEAKTFEVALALDGNPLTHYIDPYSIKEGAPTLCRGTPPGHRSNVSDRVNCPVCCRLIADLMAGIIGAQV